MFLSRASIAAVAIALAASGASAQTHLGDRSNEGLHWAVSAPEGTHWNLRCRFRPVTYERNLYDQKHWANRLNRSGVGSERGRLPSDNGNCTLRLVDGPAPLGLAIVKNGQPTKNGTAQRDRAAIVNVF